METGMSALSRTPVIDNVSGGPFRSPETNDHWKSKGPRHHQALHGVCWDNVCWDNWWKAWEARLRGPQEGGWTDSSSMGSCPKPTLVKAQNASEIVFLSLIHRIIELTQAEKSPFGEIHLPTLRFSKKTQVWLHTFLLLPLNYFVVKCTYETYHFRCPT